MKKTIENQLNSMKQQWQLNENRSKINDIQMNIVGTSMKISEPHDQNSMKIVGTSIETSMTINEKHMNKHMKLVETSMKLDGQSLKTN